MVIANWPKFVQPELWLHFPIIIHKNEKTVKLYVFLLISGFRDQKCCNTKLYLEFMIFWKFPGLISAMNTGIDCELAGPDYSSLSSLWSLPFPSHRRLSPLPCYKVRTAWECKIWSSLYRLTITTQTTQHWLILCPHSATVHFSLRVRHSLTCYIVWFAEQRAVYISSWIKH